MVLASALYSLEIPGSRSLKEKRQVLRGVLDRLRQGLRVSAAEVGDQELWNRAEVGAAAACANLASAESLLRAIDDIFGDSPLIVVVDQYSESQPWPPA